jgi:hypothetical protein
MNTISFKNKWHYDRHKNKILKKQHCSGVKIFSMCNCGMSRRIRKDPFTLKVFFNFKKLF